MLRLNQSHSTRDHNPLPRLLLDPTLLVHMCADYTFLMLLSPRFGMGICWMVAETKARRECEHYMLPMLSMLSRPQPTMEARSYHCVRPPVWPRTGDY